jgi:tetratricopeptide (TPR) repeat protein
MKIIQVLVFGLVLMLFAGCTTYKAKEHLKLKEFDKGYELTSKELENSSPSLTNWTYADLNYYHGRFLLKQKKYEEAIKYFDIAANSFPYKTFHKFWLGVAYGKNKEFTKEREIYLDILYEKNNRYKKAWAYLGKNYYKTKEYDKAIETLEEGLNRYLRKKPHSFMFYYNAKALLKKGEKEKAEEYFLKYLKRYQTRSLAKHAVSRLNKMGNFEYSNFKIGEEILATRKIEFLEKSIELEYYSKVSIRNIAKKLVELNSLEENNLTLYIVAYNKENKKQAERKAKEIKKYILREFSDIKFDDIKIAWLKTVNTINVGKKKFTQSEYVKFFTKQKG